MTNGQSRPAPRRPATTRPRQEPTEERPTAPPTPDELDAIERQHAELLRYADAEVAQDPDAGVVWVRFTRRTPALSLAKCVRWPAGSVDERLATLVDRMRAAGEWPHISIAEGVTRPATLLSTLEERGWLKVDGERIMFTRHAPVVPHLDPGLRIEAATPSTSAELVRLEAANFGFPDGRIDERAEQLAEAVGSGSVRGFLVRLVGEPVASARLVAGEGIAALTGIGVAASQRGRGYGRLVTAVATRAGLTTGHRLIWLSVDEANTAARKLYESLGYERSFAWSRWIAPAI